MSSRTQHLSECSKDHSWDVAIVGGGASGLGIAVDAVSRGLKTILFEQYDFAKGTSSKSTKLVHGGVRYLAQGNIHLVKEALEERGVLEQNARHLFHRQEFIIPNYKWWGGPYYSLGLKFYDLLSKDLSLGPSTWIKKKHVKQKLPTLKTKGLSSGISYFDGQFDDARLAINLAQTASSLGASVFNYTKVTQFKKDSNHQITHLVVEDTETGTEYAIPAKTIVNATGIFTDKIQKMQNPKHKKTVVPSQGIHLMLERSVLESDTAVMIPKTSDGRVLFVIPWHDKVIAGTTDTLIKKPTIEPVPLEDEIDFIIETLNAYLKTEVTRKDVLSVFSGLRPLAKPKKEDTSTKEVSRSHKILQDANLVSIVGGKWTTYRKMAEDVVNVICRNTDGVFIPSSTKTIAIRGNISSEEQLPDDHLKMYGKDRSAYIELENSDPLLQQKIHPKYPYTLGQVTWAVQHEMARTVEDLLSRRIRLLLLDAAAAIESAPTVARHMATLLERSQEWEEQQIASFEQVASLYTLMD